MNRPAHMPDFALMRAWGTCTLAKPLRILVSSCLNKQKTTTDANSIDVNEVHELLALRNIKVVSFCPEDFSLGTPRETPDIHNGNGFDVLRGVAYVKTESGKDVTKEMLVSSEQTLKIALENKIDVALMLDMSGSCGSQVISLGCRFDKNRIYQQGPGVSAAILIENSIPIISHRDFKSLSFLKSQLHDKFKYDESLIDHHENEWTLEYFKRDEL